jgi:urease accessory protein
MYRRALLTGLLLLASTAAYSHTGVSTTSGFSHGFAHPIGGIDHVLAMVAVGLFAAHLGGLALWAVPLSFVTMMVAGGAAGMGGMELPCVEIGIGLTVVVLGAAVAFRLHLPSVAAMALVGLFAIFHGHAHGVEMPETASGFDYALGIVLATAGLHGCGIGLGLVLGRMGEATGRRISRVAGRSDRQESGGGPILYGARRPGAITGGQASPLGGSESAGKSRNVSCSFICLQRASVCSGHSATSRRTLRGSPSSTAVRSGRSAQYITV